MLKVLISDKLSSATVQIFNDLGIETDVKVGLSPHELKTIIFQYDGLAIRSETKVTADILNVATNLKVIGRAGIGVDNIDVPGATSRGIVVMNTPFGNSITTAEHTIAMLFALARNIPQANASTHAGNWEKSKFIGIELTDKILGIIGCGNIGSIVAERSIGLKMRVIVYDPLLSKERAEILGVDKVELNDLLSRADFITLHTPLTDATCNIINAESLARTKKGVRIVNCARGSLIVEKDLKIAIESGHVAGVALDVFKEEPAKSNMLFGNEKVICTPHLGASTIEAQENVALQIAKQMSDYLLTRTITNAINMTSVSLEDASKLNPYLALVDQLGSFAGQLTEHGIKSVSVNYEGQVSEVNTKILTATILESLLKFFVETINFVNAPLIAKERNITVVETKNDRSGDYHTLIKLSVTTDRYTSIVAGTLLGGDKPRLVLIDDIPIEAEIAQFMLYVTNADKPGFIGKLGTTLGDAGVNIATFHLGRNKVGGDAIALLQVDQPMNNNLLEKVRTIPNVVQVRAMKF
ncbi:MAG: phosphoglycerate dehydrogenase [Rhodospirillaceae bacterium]|nr:phosphoglycerate dehydrogenase [Rhodospirillaceae bacterium]